MAVVIKMMGPEDMPDTNTSKTFSFLVVEEGFRYSFFRDDNFVSLHIEGRDKEDRDVIQVYPILGNCYVMDNGKTIASFAVDAYETPAFRERNIKDHDPLPIKHNNNSEEA